jgi:hypothetical protein
MSNIHFNDILSSIHFSKVVSHITTIISNQQRAGIRYFAVCAVFPIHLIRFLILPQQR